MKQKVAVMIMFLSLTQTSLLYQTNTQQRGFLDVFFDGNIEDILNRPSLLCLSVYLENINPNIKDAWKLRHCIKVMTVFCVYFTTELKTFRNFVI